MGITLGYQIKVTFSVIMPEKDSKVVEVLITSEIPWVQFPPDIQREILNDAFKICKDKKLKPVKDSGQFRIDRIVFDRSI